LTIAEADAAPVGGRGRSVPNWLRIAGRTALQLLLVYLVLLAIHAYLGWWSPEYLEGRSLWHFWFTRMIVPMVMLGVFAAFGRLIPAGAFLGAALLFVGTLSAIKRDSTGEPFQISDLFLAGQSVHLLHYVHWYHWLLGALLVPATIWYAMNLRFRRWSLPLALVCVALLSTYRIQWVANWIHDNSWWIGVENLTFSQAESEQVLHGGRGARAHRLLPGAADPFRARDRHAGA